MNSYVVDASAWLEYFEGTEKGALVKSLLEGAATKLYTSAFTLAELRSVAERRNKSYVGKIYEMVTKLSVVSDLTVILSLQAGSIHAMARAKIKDFPMGDAVVVSLARSMDCRIISTDTHFKLFAEAIVF